MGDRNAPNLYQCILGDGEEGKDEEKRMRDNSVAVAGRDG